METEFCFTLPHFNPLITWKSTLKWIFSKSRHHFCSITIEGGIIGQRSYSTLPKFISVYCFLGKGYNQLNFLLIGACYVLQPGLQVFSPHLANIILTLPCFFQVENRNLYTGIGILNRFYSQMYQHAMQHTASMKYTIITIIHVLINQQYTSRSITYPYNFGGFN